MNNNSVRFFPCVPFSGQPITILNRDFPLHPKSVARTLAFSILAVSTAAAQSLSDLLPSGTDLGDPAQRANVVAKMQALERTERDAARAKAAQRGLPLRLVKPNGTVWELADFSGEVPLYFTTHNVNAAISNGASLLQAAPLSLTGSGVTVGVWDGGSVRATHVEFGGRVTVKDGASPIDHSTHVGGTIAASGVLASAKGMATGASVDSYEWTSDKSEMTSRGATYPGESGKIYLSNHSYGFISGWNYTGKASPIWDWWGNGTTTAGVEQDFGKYDTNARDTDSLAFNAPYYLIFRSAGNDRGDNPGTGQSISLTANGSASANYDPALHPPGDAIYRNGYDTMGFDAVAKNVISVGSVSDAVSGTTRSIGAAFLSSFSACGPTDDGRIKPDVVANGEYLTSSFSSGDSAYGTISGTSMSTPSATGAAALLVKHFGNLFPGQAMRASTLKALIIHTADDRGNAGPDYQYGWGLMNVKAAADAITAYQSAPGNSRIVESRLTSAALTRTHSFTWDGVSPIRATLVWTDPAGASTTTHDLRTARLVNNLDLKVTTPGGANVLPFIMPYVGNWTNAAFSTPATTGKNNTDNVEQVLIASPGTAGTYQAVVSIDGTLTNGVQNYSLIISGSTSGVAVAPTLATVAPAAGNTGTVVMTVSGANIFLGATVKLTRIGQPDITATGIEAAGDLVKCRVDISGRAAGLWNVVVTNPGGQTSTLANAFSIIGPLWQDELESGAPGWTRGNSSGSIDNWVLSTAQSRSPTRSWFASGPASTNINDLTSPALAIPGSASNLTLSFWHRYDLQSGRDGGLLEFSVDGGAWFDGTASGSGAAFGSGGYNSSFSTTGNPNTRNPLAPRACWTGTTTVFSQVVVNLTDNAKYAGHSLRIRWRLATNSSTASNGWYIDDITLNGGGAAVNLPPSIVTDAAALPTPVTGTTTALSVAASDDAGEPSLTYTWSYTGGSFLTPVEFTENGTNAAKATTAIFSGAGAYTFTVTVRDVDGLSVQSSVDVVVEQTPGGMSIAPSSVTIGKGDTQLFTATVNDQFGAPLTVQPAATWSATGGGTIAVDGTFTATTVGGPFAVTAASGTFSAGASVTVTGETPAHWRTVNFTGAEIAGGLAGDLNDADGDNLSNLMEYALGTNPRTANVLPAAVLDGSGRLTLTLPRPKSLPGISYFGEATSELGSWPTSVPIEVIVDGDPQTIRLVDPLGTNDSARRFLRIRVTAP